jgi:hypothetical protein
MKEEGYQPKIETLLVRMTFNAPKALRKSFRIAVLATRTDLRAASDRIPRRIRPFNRRIRAHHSPACLILTGKIKSSFLVSEGPHDFFH